MVEKTSVRQPGIEVPMSRLAIKRVRAAANEANYSSAAAYIRSLIAAAIPDLKPEFDELEQWGGNRRGGEKTK